MLNALWVVLLGMMALFVIQGILFLVMSLVNRFVPPEKKKEEKG